MNQTPHAQIEDWSTFIKADGHILSRAPGLLFQQAANQPTFTAPAAAAAREWQAGRFRRPWIRWVNKPDVRDPVLFTLACTDYWIHECCFTPDGSKILTLGHDLQLWNAETGELIRNPVPSDWANHDVVRVTGTAFALAPDGRTIATDDSTGIGGNTIRVNGAVRVWDIETGDTLGVLEHDDIILTLAISTYGCYLATGTEKMTVRVFDVHTLQEVKRFTHSNRPTALAFSPGRPVLAVCSGDYNSRYEVALWDVEKDAVTGNLVHTKDVYDCAFSPDGNRLVTACTDNSLYIWDVSSQSKLFDLVGHTSWVRHCDWSSDGKLIVSGGADYELRLWNAETGEAAGVASNHTSEVFSCAFSPDGRRIVSGDQDQTAIVWDASAISSSGRVRQRKEMRGGDFSHDAAELAAASSGCVELWSAASGKNTRTLFGEKGDHYDCSYSPDGSRLAAGSDSGLLVWDLKTGDRILTMRVSDGHVDSCLYSPDGRWLAAAATSSLTVLDAKTHRVARVISYDRGIHWCAFSLDSNRVIDSHLQMWDIATGQRISSIGLDKNYAWEYSPDRTRVLITRQDKTLSVADATTCKTLLVIGGGARLYGGTYTPDQHWIAAGLGQDLGVYNADSGKEVARFVAGGPLLCIVTSNTHLACGTRGMTYLLEMHGLGDSPEEPSPPACPATSTSRVSRFLRTFFGL